MQPQLILEDGTQVPLPADVYEQVLRILRDYEAAEAEVEPAESLEALEAEFAELFENAPSTADLLEERRLEREREERKYQRFA